MTIVDIGVRHKHKGEQPPSGFQTVDRTVGGHDASTNAGASFSLFSGSKKLYLCVRKTAGPLEEEKVITDVTVFDEKTEAAPIGYDVVRKSVSGEYSGNLNHHTGGANLYLAIKRQNRDEATEALEEIVLILPNKESTPRGTRVVNRSLNQGSSGHDIRLGLQFVPLAPVVRRQADTSSSAAASTSAAPSSLANDAALGAAAMAQGRGLSRKHSVAGPPVSSETLLSGVSVRLSSSLQTMSSLLDNPFPELMRRFPPLTEEDLLGKYTYDFSTELGVLEHSRA